MEAIKLLITVIIGFFLVYALFFSLPDNIISNYRVYAISLSLLLFFIGIFGLLKMFSYM